MRTRARALARVHVIVAAAVGVPSGRHTFVDVLRARVRAAGRIFCGHRRVALERAGAGVRRRCHERKRHARALQRRAQSPQRTLNSAGCIHRLAVAVAAVAVVVVAVAVARTQKRKVRVAVHPTRRSAANILAIRRRPEAQSSSTHRRTTHRATTPSCTRYHSEN